jgi:hypothetical protein
LSYLVPSLVILSVACYRVALFSFENSNLPSFCLRWETIRTAPSRMAIYAQGDCTVTASLCCCGMPLCRLATGTEPQSTTVGSMRSTGCSAARSTSISHPTPCFLTGAHDPRGLFVIPRSEREETKPPYVCPRCSNHTYSNNMITRFHVQ